MKLKALDDVFFVTSRWKPVPGWTVKLTPIPLLPQAPIPAGTRLGTFTILVNGKPQATGDAVTVGDVAVRPAVAFVRTTATVGLTLVKIAGVLAALAALVVGGLALYARTIAKGARRRRDRLAPGLRSVDSRGPRPR